MSEQAEAFDPVVYAEQACARAGLTAEQVHGVQAYLVGVFSSYVDNPDASRLTTLRWRFYVQEAIRDITA